jgi:hypothetical protein
MHGSAFRQHGYSNLQVIVVGDLNPPLFAVKNTANGWVSSKRHATSADAAAEIETLNGTQLLDGEGNEE